MAEQLLIIPADGNEVLQAKYIPKQNSLVEPDSPSMKAYISTFPPLGQVTLVDDNTTTFTACLEVDGTRANQEWQVSLWHSETGEWYETPLERLGITELGPTCVPCLKAGASLLKIFFRTRLPGRLPTSFTVKFRNGNEQSWKWAKDHQGAEDGTVILKTLTSKDGISKNLGDYVEDLNPIIKFREHLSQSPGTNVWSVELPIEAADGENPAVKDVKFGVPWGHQKVFRWFALVRIWAPWLAPRQGKMAFELDEEAVLCSFVSQEGKHLVLLAISGIDDVMTLFTSTEGAINLHVQNDSNQERVARIIVGLGDNFESANAAVMYHARGIVSSAEVATIEQHKETKAMNKDDELTKLWTENWYDGLTYCTWNALGQQLTEEKVLNAVEVLAKNKINFTNFIIDDNWQAIDYKGDGQFQHGWIEFEAERKAFPNGLKHLVSKIKEKQPSIQHVAVWHAILGYWGGLATDGKIAKTYKTRSVVREDAERRNLPLGGQMTVVDKEDVGQFYDDFYRFLSSCGVDAVKTDAQFMLDTFVSAVDRRDLISAYLDAWTVSTLRNFSVKAISCMSQTPQILFRSQMPQNRPPLLVRNSDDFFPDISSSHPWHIWTNAHNALFTQYLNVVPDWDMFQTVHNYSGFHAAARCVSGGPVYITDVPGEHDFDLISQMTGQTPRGKTVIFRPSVMGKALDQYNGYDDDRLLLVGAYHGAAEVGTGIVGIFNVSQRPLSELIPLSKFPGVIEGQHYIIRTHNDGYFSRPMQTTNDPDALFSISLGVRGYDILSAYTLTKLVNEKASSIVSIANLGLLGKMSGAAAVVDNKMTMLESGKIVIETDIKALGILGFYISDLPNRSIADTMLITILGQVVPVHTVTVSKVDSHVLEINIERAWNELGLESKWSNEVGVKIYLNSIHY